MDDETEAGWSRALLDWYRGNRRDLPWRADRAPYPVWVSEIMLQQTQVKTAIPYFLRFMQAFPSLQRLAAADEEDVLRVWEGLGYYSRALNLLKAARELVSAGRERLPQDFQSLKSLPGVGEYTAAAIASISFNEPVPAVDGNALRVFARFWGIAADIKRPSTARLIRERLARHIDTAHPGAWNQAVMDLGSLVCTPRAPDCVRCPLRSACAARATGSVDELPARSGSRPAPLRRLAAGIVCRRGKILIVKRRAGQMLGGLWQFPAAEIADNEPPSQSACRAVAASAGLTVNADKDPAAALTHAYSHFRVRLDLFRCGPARGRARALGVHDAVAWVTLDELPGRPCCALTRKAAQRLAETGKVV